MSTVGKSGVGSSIVTIVCYNVATILEQLITLYTEVEVYVYAGNGLQAVVSMAGDSNVS